MAPIAMDSTELGFVTSFREFARDTSIRNRAIKERKPILVEDKRKKEFFFLVPPEMYSKLHEKYQDWCDVETIKETMTDATPSDFTDWETVKKELSVQENEY